MTPKEALKYGTCILESNLVRDSEPKHPGISIESIVKNVNG